MTMRALERGTSRFYQLDDAHTQLAYLRESDGSVVSMTIPRPGRQFPPRAAYEVRTAGSRTEGSAEPPLRCVHPRRRQLGRNPKRYLQLLLGNDGAAGGCVQPYTPLQIARWLLTTEGLSKNTIGALFALKASQPVFDAFADTLDFYEFDAYDEALRFFTSLFRLQGESQQVGVCAASRAGTHQSTSEPRHTSAGGTQQQTAGRSAPVCSNDEAATSTSNGEHLTTTQPDSRVRVCGARA
eukprot:3158527-Prymnesium_polylepis.2